MANPPAKSGQNGKPLPLSEETLEKLLAVQSQELAIRLKEIERDNAEIGLNKSVAQQSIEAQERDRRHDREEQTKRQGWRHIFVVVLTVIALAFVGYVIHAGHASIVVDLIKVVLGFVGGMGYQAYRQRRNRQEQDDD